MAELNLDQALRELTQGKARSFYWIYGPERSRGKKLLESLRESITQAFPNWSKDFCEESLDGSSLSLQAFSESLHCFSPLGGPRLIIVQDAQQVAWSTAQAQWPSFFDSQTTLHPLNSICVCIASDLDQRTKWAQHLLKHAAIIECGEPRPLERGSAVQEQAFQRGLKELPRELLEYLRVQEPWSSEGIERELELWELCHQNLERYFEAKGGAGFEGGAPSLVESFFKRDLKPALRCLMSSIQEPSESFMLLGLLAWWVRQLLKSGSTHQTGVYRQRQIQEWSRQWDTQALHDLHHELSRMDLLFKSSGESPLGSWQTLLFRFCR